MRAEPSSQPRTAPELHFQWHTGREAFLALREDWNALAHACGNPVFGHHAYLTLWMEHFGHWPQLRVLTGRDAAGQLVAALPLLRRHESLYGVPARVLCSPTNEHSGRFDLLALDPEGVAPAILRALEALATRWDVLRLSPVPEGGRLLAVAKAAERAGFPVGVLPGPLSPYFPLPQGQGALEKQLSRNLRSNLKRRRRRLEELGPVTLERISDQGRTLHAGLREAFELEAAGWKGRGRTAILQDPKTLGFYAGLAMWAADEGALDLSILRLSGRAVAFDLGLRAGNRYLSFKHGYAEDVAPCSPGQLLTWEMVRRCAVEHVAEVDFMGEPDSAKSQWTSQVRAHHFVFAFGHTWRGRLLAEAKLRLVPALKRMRKPKGSPTQRPGEKVQEALPSSEPAAAAAAASSSAKASTGAAPMA